MFKKLFKHDLKSVIRFIVPILLVLAALTLVGAIDAIALGRVATSMSEDASFLDIMLVMMTYFLLLLVIIAIGAIASVVQILVLVNYYKSTVSDEAYLTFTLPVKPRDILISKLLNSSLWSIVMTIASAISIGIIVVCLGLSTIDLSNIFLPSEPSIPSEPFVLEAGMVVVLILMLLIGIAYFFNSQLLYFMSITFSSTITRKHKVLSAIGCVIGANAIYGILSNVIFTICSVIGLGAGTSSSNPYTVIIVALSIMLAILVASSIFFFLATKYMLEKKLNLA